jgi:hypothetical protein
MPRINQLGAELDLPAGEQLEKLSGFRVSLLDGEPHFTKEDIRILMIRKIRVEHHFRRNLLLAGRLIVERVHLNLRSTGGRGLKQMRAPAAQNPAEFVAPTQRVGIVLIEGDEAECQHHVTSCGLIQPPHIGQIKAATSVSVPPGKQEGRNSPALTGVAVGNFKQPQKSTFDLLVHKSFLVIGTRTSISGSQELQSRRKRMSRRDVGSSTPSTRDDRTHSKMGSN